MIRYLSILFTFVSLSAPVHADDWSTEDIVREATYMSLLAIDWSQTRTIARSAQVCKHRDVWGRPRGDTDNPCWHEINPLLGDAPTVKQVDKYFVASAALHLVIANALPSEWRETFQNAGIVFEAAFVGHNINLGIESDF